MSVPFRTVADFLRAIGDVPPDRVRMDPAPGTATADDLLRSENDGCELVDGALVQKAMGLDQAVLAGWVATYLNAHVRARNLGAVTGRRGPFRLSVSVTRCPDVAFASWDRMPGPWFPSEPIAKYAPDLAVEMVYPANTPGELARKRADYFTAGVRLVWEIDTLARVVRTYTAADTFTDLTAADALDGADVLPGFRVPLADLFAEIDRRG